MKIIYLRRGEVSYFSHPPRAEYGSEDEEARLQRQLAGKNVLSEWTLYGGKGVVGAGESYW